MPPFRYFLAPPEQMAGLTSGPEICVFCGTQTRGFDLTRAGIFPASSGYGCGACLQAGRFHYTKSTEFGTLLEEGVILNESIFEETDDFLTPYSAVERTGFPEALLRALQRTPEFHDWNEVPWRVCCKDFMAYLGTWQPRDFHAHTPDGNGRALCERILECGNMRFLWPENQTPTTFEPIAVHVFRCLHCAKLRAVKDST